MTLDVYFGRSIMVRVLLGYVVLKQTIKAQAQGFLLRYIGFICVYV